MSYRGLIEYHTRLKDDELMHHGILGMKWGVRRFQNYDGTLTPEGIERYRSPKYQEKVAKRLARDGQYAVGYDMILSGSPINRHIRSTRKAQFAEADDHYQKVAGIVKNFWNSESKLKETARRHIAQTSNEKNPSDLDILDLISDVSRHPAREQWFFKEYLESHPEEKKVYESEKKKFDRSYKNFQKDLADDVQYFLGKYGDTPINSTDSRIPKTVGDFYKNMLLGDMDMDTDYHRQWKKNNPGDRIPWGFIGLYGKDGWSDHGDWLFW